MRILLIACFCGLAWLSGWAIAGATGPTPPVGLPRGAGVDLAWDCCDYSAVTALSANWFIDYRSSNERMDGPGHVFLVEHQISPGALTAYAAAHIWHSWQLGNEPNDTTGYGDLCGTPAQCGALWRAQAAGIRAGDPNATLIIAGLANADPGYAQALVDAGADIGSAWCLHYYTQRADAADVLDKVRAFQAWEQGRSDSRPVLVGETGIWAVPESVAPPAIRALGAGLPALGVPAWAWFSARSGGRWGGDLLAPDGALTAAGRAFWGLSHPAPYFGPRWWRPHA